MIGDSFASIVGSLATLKDSDQLLATYRYGPPEAFPRALGSAAEVAPLIVLLAGDRGRGLNGLLLSLGGDKLSIWQPPAETSVAFLNGGWTVAELERCMEFALGIDLSTTQRSLDGVTHG